jgi:hypothetical protein
MLPLHLALKKIQMMISLQMVQVLGFLDDFLGDCDGEGIYFLILEECVRHVEDI